MAATSMLQTPRGPAPNYFDLNVKRAAARVAMPVARGDDFPRNHQPYRNLVLPQAGYENHARKVLSLKPYPRPVVSHPAGLAPMTAGMVAPQGFARHQAKGLAYMIDGKDRTKGPLAKQADSQFAALNSSIPLPK